MPKYAAYEAAAPYFDLVRGALGDLVDGEHFFDIVTDDVVYEVLYDFPGWPRMIRGCADLMAQFRGYVDNIALQSHYNLLFLFFFNDTATTEIYTLSLHDALPI